MTTYIVTGTTRGIGRSLAAVILDKGHDLYTLSRSSDHRNGHWQNLQCDLRRSNEVVDAMQRILDQAFRQAPDEIVLVNNAGQLAPMGPIETATAHQIIEHLHVNQGAPIILISTFMRLSRGLALRRRIINISSGAARFAYAGWALYCASKAALDMITRCVAAEQMHGDDPISICTVGPGKVDTRMQEQIRESDPVQFPSQPDFVKAKKRGDLLDPDHVARVIIALDQKGQLKNGGIYDLRGTEFDAQGRITGLAVVES